MKMKFSQDIAMFAGLFIPDSDVPSVTFAAQILNSLGKVDGESFLAVEGIEKDLRQGTIIDVGTSPHARRGDDLTGITALHDERNPFFDLLFVVGIFHPAIAVMGGERLEALFQECDIFRSAHETHVRDGMNKRLRIFDRALLYQVRPELPGKIELRIDLEGLRNIVLPSFLAGV